MRITVEGTGELNAKLSKLAKTDFEQSIKRAAADVYNMGQTKTPKKTGELRQSMAVNRNSSTEYEVGYAKEYAPHVEYGHRTRNGGYVEGQYFLKDMIESEESRFFEYVRDQIC